MCLTMIMTSYGQAGSFCIMYFKVKRPINCVVTHGKGLSHPRLYHIVRLLHITVYLQYCAIVHYDLFVRETGFVVNYSRVTFTPR